MLRFEFAVVADLTANVLSVCLVVFLLLLPLAGGAPAPRDGPQAAERVLHLTERRPLSGPDMVRLLHARRADPRQLSLDLFADRIELVSGTAAARAISAAEAGALGGAPVLFVFDPALYPALRAAQGAAPVAAEMSVPFALRDPANPRRGWSADFRQLDAAPRPRAAFDGDLARILQAAPPRPVPGGGGAEGVAAFPEGLASRLLERLAALLDAVLRIALPIAVFAALALVEIRRRCRPAGAVPYGMEARGDLQ